MNYSNALPRFILLIIICIVVFFTCGCNAQTYLPAAVEIENLDPHQSNVEDDFEIDLTSTYTFTDCLSSPADGGFSEGIDFGGDPHFVAPEESRYEEVNFKVIRVTAEDGEIKYYYEMEHDRDQSPCDALNRVIETAKENGCDDVEELHRKRENVKPAAKEWRG